MTSRSRTCESCRFYEERNSLCCVDPPAMEGGSALFVGNPQTWYDRPACSRYQLDLAGDDAPDDDGAYLADIDRQIRKETSL